MKEEAFRLQIITPLRVFSREIRSLRLKDKTGFFGIMAGHCDFLTVLVPSLGYYQEMGGKECFLAVDGGIFCMREGAASITSREVFESDDAGRLAELIKATIAHRDASDLAVFRMIKGIERSFLEKSAALAKGRS